MLSRFSAVFDEGDGFGQDLKNLLDIVNVTKANEEDLPRICKVKKMMVQPSASNYCSRFAKALQLFPTGLKIAEAVDLEQIQISADDGNAIQLKSVQEMATWQEVVVG